MILARTTVNGKEYFEEISETMIGEYEDEELIYVDEKEDHTDRESMEFVNDNYSLESHGGSFDVSGVIRGVGSVFNLFKARYDDIDHEILRMLPFLDEGDIHQLVCSIIAGEKELPNRKIVSMLPFMKQDDCDALFEYYLSDPEMCNRLSSFGPFISTECLSRFTENFISGKYDDLHIEISALYPFMDSDDVKKLFFYYATK